MSGKGDEVYNVYDASFSIFPAEAAYCKKLIFYSHY